MPDDIIKPEVSHPTECCPHPELWSCYDDESTELEVLTMLQALVILLKPQRVIETGCFHGHGTRHLALGVRDNGFGYLWTTDIGLDMVQTTQQRVAACGFAPIVHVAHGSGLQLIADVPGPIDFAFLDSGADDMRCLELRALLLKLSPNGVVAIHDTGEQHGLRAHFLETVRELGLMYFMFDTPRGLSLVRQPPWKT